MCVCERARDRELKDEKDRESEKERKKKKGEERKREEAENIWGMKGQRGNKYSTDKKDWNGHNKANWG